MHQYVTTSDEAVSIAKETSKPSRPADSTRPPAQPVNANTDCVPTNSNRFAIVLYTNMLGHGLSWCCVVAEETSKPSIPAASIGPLAQPADAKADIALSDSKSSNSSTSMLAHSPAEALSMPHGIGVVSSKAVNGTNGNENGNENGNGKHAKRHKAQASNALHLQRKASPPG